MMMTFMSFHRTVIHLINKYLLAITLSILKIHYYLYKYLLIIFKYLFVLYLLEIQK